MAACVYYTDREMGKVNFKFCCVFFFKDCIYITTSSNVDARLIPCADETTRQLSFQKDTHVKFLAQCLRHSKCSNNEASTTKLVLISVPTYCPTQPRVSTQQEEASMGTRKPAKVWEDQTLGTNVLTLQLTTATGGEVSMGRGYLLLCLCGGWTLPSYLSLFPAQTKAHFIF